MDEHRLYFAEAGWEPKLNHADFRMHCYHQEPNDDHYHRIAVGELYLARDDEALCFNCAIKRGVLTVERPTLENQGFVRL